MTGSINNVYQWVNLRSYHIKIKAARELNLLNSKVKTKFSWLDNETPVQKQLSSSQNSKLNNKQSLTNANINSSSIKDGSSKEVSQPRNQQLPVPQEQNGYAPNKPVSEEGIDADVSDREGTKNNNTNPEPFITATTTYKHAATPGKQIASAKNSNSNHFTTVDKHATITTSMHNTTMDKHATITTSMHNTMMDKHAFNANSFHITTMDKHAINTTSSHVFTMNKHTTSTPNASSHVTTSSNHATTTSKNNTLTDAALKITAVPFQATKEIPSRWITSNVSPDLKSTVNDRKRSLVKTNSPIVGTEDIEERDPAKKKIRLANPKKAVDMPIKVSSVIPNRDRHSFKIKEGIRMAKLNEAADLPIQVSNVIPRRDPYRYIMKKRYNLGYSSD